MAIESIRDIILDECPDMQFCPDLLDAMGDDLEDVVAEWVAEHRHDYVAENCVGASCVQAVLSELDTVVEEASSPDSDGFDCALTKTTRGDVLWVDRKEYEAAFAGYPEWYRCLWEAVASGRLKDYQAAAMSAEQILEFWRCRL